MHISGGTSVRDSFASTDSQNYQFRGTPTLNSIIAPALSVDIIVGVFSPASQESSDILTRAAAEAKCATSSAGRK
jgi:hypothetical protein